MRKSWPKIIIIRMNNKTFYQDYFLNHAQYFAKFIIEIKIFLFLIVVDTMSKLIKVELD